MGMGACACRSKRSNRHTLVPGEASDTTTMTHRDIKSYRPGQASNNASRYSNAGQASPRLPLWRRPCASACPTNLLCPAG